MRNYNFTFCFVRVRNLVSDTKEREYIEGARELDTKDNIWT
jgi:hypothetical protein